MSSSPNEKHETQINRVDIHHLQAQLGYRFTKPTWLIRAATHPGALDANLSPGERLEVSNERMEFLGDALLGSIISEWICERHPQADEGELSRLKGLLVSRRTLAKIMDQHQLTQGCRLGPGIQADQVPTSIKANLAEAIFAAIYFDGGYAPLKQCLYNLYAEEISVDEAPTAAEWKNVLQQWALKEVGTLPVYTSERQGGSDHEPVFSATVQAGDHQAAATGTSRRRAEAAAAHELCKNLNVK